MLVEHRGKRPLIHESAYVAPNAVICGDVTLGENSRVLFGAVLVAEGGPVVVGSHCIIMEHAVVRGTPRHPAHLGNHVLVGPHAYLTGCSVADSAFLATGATVFNGARIGTRAEVRINGVVHLRTVLPADAVVPIGWVAVGDPAEILPAENHDRIWAVQEPLDFPRTVFGLERAPAGETIMPELTRRYAGALGRHREDRILEGKAEFGIGSHSAIGNGEGMMIARIWHGWTTLDNADLYENLLKTEIFPGIASKGVQGYRGIQLLRRPLGEEVEFLTIMWFDSWEAVKHFAGEDHERAYVPPKARAVLARFDERSQHYEVRETLEC